MTTRLRTVLATAALLAVSFVIAWAYWTAPGSGAVAVVSGSFAAATVDVPASATNSVAVSLTQQASLEPDSANADIMYSVERSRDGGPWAAVSSGGCSGDKPYGTTACTDTPPGNGSYAYRVVASYATWTATSAAAGPVAYSDTSAPTVEAQVSPAPNAAGWNRTAVTVALDAEDAGGSGVAQIEYTSDGSDPTSSATASTYTAPIPVGDR
jgi:hypothetical protein